MADLGVDLVFLFGGAILVNFAPTPKFLILAIILGMVYFGFNLIFVAQFGESVIAAISAFVFVQIGYVCGLAVKFAYINLFPKNALPSSYRAVIEEKTRIK